MQKNILEYLEQTVCRVPNKMAFDDDKEQITFKELKQSADAIGSALVMLGETRKPIVVYLPKGCDCITAFMGIVSSGNFYCPIDETMPLERIKLILSILKPIAIITNEKMLGKIEPLHDKGTVWLFDEIIKCSVNFEELHRIRQEQIDTDPLYVLFTSGSTGIPKGVLISHRSVIDYIDWVSETFSVSEKDIFGNQAPFYFDNSILDIYCALKNGSSVYIIPKRKFSFPVELLAYLNEKEINFVFWVPSALCMVVNTKALEVVQPRYLKKILFCGEVMPNRHLNVWRKAIPDALYANLYGPTEITDVCTFFLVNRNFRDDEPLPIGFPCNNTRILVLNEHDREARSNEAGELCVVGTSLSLGYYGNTEKTELAFIQNPLNHLYPEKIYRTGDLVKYNEFGELIYIARKDFQIKHMGYRIELGEIETVLMGMPEVENCACIYDDNRSKIVACYTGQKVEEQILTDYLKKHIPHYMIPEYYLHYNELPHNANGKIDRLALKNNLVKQQ